MNDNNEIYHKYISSVSQLKIGDFIDYPDWVKNAFSGDGVSPKRLDLIDRKSSTLEQQVEWFAKMLSDNDFTRVFYMAFSQIPFVRVNVLDEDDWVGTLFQQINQSWLILSLEMDRLLLLQTAEIFPYNDCYVAYLYLKDD